MMITIVAQQEGKRLDRVLQEIFPTFSRSQIQKQFFDRSRVLIGDKRATKHYFVHVGERITIIEAEQKIETTVSPSLQPTIIFENESYVVLDKPSGMIAHQTGRHIDYSVVDFLLQRYPAMSRLGEDPLRPGIVHRLDKDASGVMVAAKTQAMADLLKRQFKLREVQKEYLILVYGQMPRMEGEITFSLGRAKHSPRIAATSGGGRQATTQYHVEEKFSRYSLVRVTPRTGRTHQIRVHFFALGYPVVGDPIYMPKRIKKVNNARLMLHACRLGFRDLDGIWREYYCPPGKDFTAVIETLRV